MWSHRENIHLHCCLFFSSHTYISFGIAVAIAIGFFCSLFVCFLQFLMIFYTLLNQNQTSKMYTEIVKGWKRNHHKLTNGPIFYLIRKFSQTNSSSIHLFRSFNNFDNFLQLDQFDLVDFDSRRSINAISHFVFCNLCTKW